MTPRNGNHRATASAQAPLGPTPSGRAAPAPGAEGGVVVVLSQSEARALLRRVWNACLYGSDYAAAHSAVRALRKAVDG